MESHSTFLTSMLSAFGKSRLWSSAKMADPPNTRTVPIQCSVVNEFPKKNIDTMSDMNLRTVTTSVTVNEVHSVVRRKTRLMQKYLVSYRKV